LVGPVKVEIWNADWKQTLKKDRSPVKKASYKEDEKCEFY
jgi:hypothetical protein